MPKFPFDPRLVASPLLASTCVTALLLGAVPARAGQNITTPQASVTNPAGQATTSILITGTTVTGAVANAGTISPGTQVNIGATAALAVTGSEIGGGIANTGAISASGENNVSGILVQGGTTVIGAIANSNMITTSTGGQNSLAAGIFLSNATVSGSNVTGGITNTGTISESAGGEAVGVFVNNGTITGGINNNGTITTSSPSSLAFGIVVQSSSTISGGIANGGTISSVNVNGANGGQAVGVFLLGAGDTTVTGGIANTGTISASSANNAAGILLTASTSGGSTVAGGIANGGTISANASLGSGVAGGIVVQGNNTVSDGIANSGTISALSGGGHASGIFVAGILSATNSLSGSFASVTTTNPFFTASVSPDAATPNALDATLSLSPTGVARLAPSAQDLTQNLRLGLDAPQVLGQAVEDRLVASGGVLGEGGDAASASTVLIGRANLWVRAADQFGSASGHAVSPGYDVNRTAPLIGGVDWHLDSGIVLGTAATYVATSASFKDGTRTNVSSYQGAVYAGWAGGPWYALGSVVASVNNFATGRLLTPFGFPGAPSSSPSGQSYAGYAEAGYRWLQAGFTVTPYAALDYVHASIDSFDETGAFGLSVNGVDGNSFATTLGVRATTRISWGDHAVLIPELRLGWNHEFLDASQTISASVIGVPGSTFSATGITFGRDAALIGAGFSMELSPDAKVFVDYDGRLGSRLQEHSISGGLKVRF
ncbi:MAG: autotransporter domain-containing protein [Hyphomicrobiales bacterium]|nr:autotransporter domain-containing protein [Hyphomicrobiales bacterium]